MSIDTGQVSFTVKDGPPHPYQASMEKLLKKSGELNVIHKQVFQAAKTQGMKKTAMLTDSAKLLEWAKKNGVYDRLRKIVETTVTDVSEARGKIPAMNLRPPRASELYERCAPGMTITDVGAGDSKRTSRYHKYFGKVESIDVVLQEPKVIEPAHWVRAERAVVLEEPNVLTSFNVVTQMSVEQVATLEENDGIHVMPNMDKLLAAGIAKKREDGKVVSKMGDTTFEENYVKPQGVELGMYYNGFNTYRRQTLVVKLGNRLKVKGRTVKGSYKRVTGPVPLVEPTWKIDGKFYNLRLKDGLGVLADRRGDGFAARINTKMKMDLDLELCGDRLFLLRVNSFRRFKPYHSLDMLEKFVSRVEMTINTKKLEAPPRTDKTIQNDGLVVRDRGVDYVFNHGVSIDVLGAQAEEFRNFLRHERCVVIRREVGRPIGGMNIVTVYENDDGTCLLSWVGRDDKEKPDAREQWYFKFDLARVVDLMEGKKMVVEVADTKVSVSYVDVSKTTGAA